MINLFDKQFEIYNADCRKVMKEFANNSIDSIVTDPPYGLQFMGKEWDKGVPGVEFWTEMLRIIKPGGYLLAFGGTRTFHRLTCSIEDSGFEIRDCLSWLDGSGFPKSHNISKAIEKISLATPNAAKWEGWGTALKPAWEPIILARKPLRGTVTQNVLEFGTGGLNIDGSRIEGEPTPINRLEKWSGFGQEKRPEYSQEINTAGRWPANVIHDGSEEAIAGFPETKSPKTYKRNTEGMNSSVYAKGMGEPAGKESLNFGDSGSAARFFYCAKASKADRDEGNNHPTVKPSALMRHLCRLVTQPDGLILDPFSGSGSTGKAALLEGFRFLGAELDPEYAEIARARCLAAEIATATATAEPEPEPDAQLSIFEEG
jgi:site-specific DNA-methyltransferase (adenine-specific)